MLFDQTKLFEYATKLQTLRGQENWIFKRVLDRPDLKRKIIELNTQRQLGDEGIDALGNILGFYSIVTEFMSNGAKKAGDPYTLNDTGAFWASFDVQVLQGHISINANGQKDTDNLFDKFGIDILGLTDENLQLLIEDAKGYYIEYYRSIL